MNKNKIYYKVLRVKENNLINKDQPNCPSFYTQYKLNDWTYAKDNTRLFVFEKLDNPSVTSYKEMGYKVFKCHIGRKNIRGNAVHYTDTELSRILNCSNAEYYTKISIITKWFWDNVEKNIKAKKKYNTGMKKYLFSIKNVVMTDKVKLIEEL